MTQHPPIDASQLNEITAPCPDGHCRLPDGICAEPGIRLCRQNIHGTWSWHACSDGAWIDTGEPCGTAWETLAPAESGDSK